MSPPSPRLDTWLEYRQLILTSIETLNAAILQVNTKLDLLRHDDISKLKVEVAMLQVRASIFGGLAGAVGGALLGALIAKLVK